eukprot:TRINITY_DN25199_c0_g1_i1.p1 TRINITY_DN25199_c0_g1~~TRINITY_DN25199_c0_g1_i1.p1  ORF type:complete len:116 (-),score=14.84 TRINITY_DN25199_c0_g1_i1:313-660(-)
MTLQTVTIAGHVSPDGTLAAQIYTSFQPRMMKLKSYIAKSEFDGLLRVTSFLTANDTLFVCYGSESKSPGLRYECGRVPSKVMFNVLDAIQGVVPDGLDLDLAMTLEFTDGEIQK